MKRVGCGGLLKFIKMLRLCDCFCGMNRRNKIAVNNNNHKVCIPLSICDDDGYEKQHDAFVLYAKEDKQFVDLLLETMRAEGFMLCTEDDLLASLMTPYALVAKLVIERCRRIILVCSPEFFSSQADTFYLDYMKQPDCKIIPIIYRECQLPSYLAYYHKLWYLNNEDHRIYYDFWFKLKQLLQ